MDLTLPALQLQPTLIGISVALGIGLLVGAERERRKDSSPERSAAGIRTFAVASLMGAVGLLLGGVELLALAAGVGVALAVWACAGWGRNTGCHWRALPAALCQVLPPFTPWAGVPARMHPSWPRP